MGAGAKSQRDGAGGNEEEGVGRRGGLGGDGEVDGCGIETAKTAGRISES